MLTYDLAHWSAFLAAALLLNLSPGPDIAFILGHTVRGGVRSGMAAMLGIWTGAFGHVLLATVGLSAIVAASAAAFDSGAGIRPRCGVSYNRTSSRRFRLDSSE